MRANLPIVDEEFPFPEGETLVSTTDLKGRITHCNKTFVAVSGYSAPELLGQAHNIIRHPDVPEEAFRDLWHTIQQGRPWSGVVKNRRKDGRYYWVVANATPLMNGNQPMGYLSVRTQPTAAQIKAAESLYALLNAEKAAGVRIHQLQAGHLIRTDRWSRLKTAVRQALGGHAGWPSCAAMALIAASAGWWAHDMAWSASSTVVMAVVVSMLLGSLTAWHLRRKHHQPLRQLLQMANRIAAGDMRDTVTSYRSDLAGQLEQALQQMCVNVRSIVHDARMEAQSMHHVTQTIAAGNSELSTRTESQASSLGETASSIDQITGTVQHSAESAKEVNALALQASHVTQRSSDAVHTVTQTMQEIAEASKRIGEIIQLIDSIAFQTNILALNAAVEAARAGEQGRGFAVVATEVRMLAGRTSGAAREIKKLIEDSNQKVNTGERQTRDAQTTMDEALETVRRVSTVIKQITDSAEEQLIGISQVNQAVSSMDMITQQNAILVQDLAQSAGSLTAQAAAVAESVSIFRLDNQDAQRAQPDAVGLRKAHRV